MIDKKVSDNSEFHYECDDDQERGTPEIAILGCVDLGNTVYLVNVHIKGGSFILDHFLQ